LLRTITDEVQALWWQRFIVLKDAQFPCRPLSGPAVRLGFYTL